MSHLADPLAAPLKQLGVQLSPRATAVLEVGLLVVPLVLVGAAAGYVWWKKRNEGPKSALDPSSASVAGAQVTPNQLRRAWKRFVKQLPPSFERSILNFEHFVVLGAAGSGKSRVIDTYSDWRRQAKQLPGSQTHDPDLPVYLASGLIVTELPARFLTDHSARCQQALRNLWGPLYKRRAPSVVVTLDVRRLREGTAESLQELAESVRAKINLLSAIRGRPVEARVVLTFLDTLEGYAELARFCRDESIPTRAQIVLGEGAPDPGSQIEAWIDALREHLPRALTRLSSTDYLRVVAFLRSAPELAAPLGKFIASLFAHEALSLDPVCGGVFMAADPAGAPSPLDRAVERGPGPDPRRKHLFATAVAASAIVAYLVGAYRAQRDHHRAAEQALEAYALSHEVDAGEPALRGAITAFTSGSRGFMESHPDYFASARQAMRRRFSDAVRDRLLVPQLERAAREGKVAGDSRDLPTRRSLYFLALVHSDKADRIGLSTGSNARLWSRMTGLPVELLRDYIQNTDAASTQVRDVDVMHRDVEPRSTWQAWADFLRAVDASVKAGARRPEELRELAAQAKQLESMLPMYEEDEITVTLLDRLDVAAGTAPVEKEGVRPLKQAYRHKFADFADNEPRYRVREQSERLSTVLRQVEKAGVLRAAAQPLLRDLVARLKAAAEADARPSAGDEARLSMAGQDFVFDSSNWQTMLRGSNGRELVEQFLRAASAAPSMFFDGSDDQALPSRRWNPSNDGSAIFLGRGEIPGRYTKEGYDSRVAAVVKELPEALDKAKVPDEQRRQVQLAVLEAVRRYATEYRGQTAGFIRSFTLRAPSPEALRVGLAEMAKPEGTSYQEFLVTVAQNTRIDDDKVPLLQPMVDATGEFRAFREVVGEGGKGAELGKYRSILSQLLSDLSAPAGAAAGEGATGPETLEKALSPAGRLVLAEVKGEKGSYAQLVSEWLLSVSLADYQRHVFAAPLGELTRIGRRDIERVVSQAWEAELLPDVRKLATRFPFDPSSQEDASPAELTAVFHPQTGKYFDVFRRYFEPLSDFGDGGPFRAKPSVRARVSLPGQLYELTNVAAALSARLWDGAGKPATLPVRVATVPFEHGRNPRLAQTLVYMNVGPGSLFNFNQKPAEVVMQLDWTKEYNAQVGLQLTDVDTKENVFPEPIKAEGSFWAFLRLLRRGQGEAVKSPPGAQLYTWQFRIAREGTESMPAQYVVVDDVWSLFALGPYVRARLASGPAPAAGGAR